MRRRKQYSTLAEIYRTNNFSIVCFLPEYRELLTVWVQLVTVINFLSSLSSYKWGCWSLITPTLFYCSKWNIYFIRIFESVIALSAAQFLRYLKYVKISWRFFFLSAFSIHTLLTTKLSVQIYRYRWCRIIEKYLLQKMSYVVRYIFS